MTMQDDAYGSPASGVYSPTPTTYSLDDPGIPNIILFGETGSGKSSIVNMLAGRDEAAISNGARGCTFKNESYIVNIEKKQFRIFDTAGFDESTQGTVPNHDAIAQLYKLLAGLHNGVNLLILCVRGPRLRGVVQYNWTLFKDVICQGKVPAVIAITGMEAEEGDMDDWWTRNKDAFHANDIYPSGFACITATKGKLKRGKGYQFQDEYDESKEKMTRLIMNTYREKAWRVGRVDWYRKIVETSYESRMCWKSVEKQNVKEMVGPGVEHLVNQCMMPKEEAELLGRRLAGVNDELREIDSY
ncbi:hypothetical protein AX16_007863 [Volvariella volvacea WC 439]|nr:hypothetical protein AX16_007863 [Volvariella volvacea WC 439]